MKKKIVIRFIPFSILVLSFFAACRPGTQVEPVPINCDSVNTVLIPEDMKARFYFKEGTYWIYKNLTNGEIDSVWVYLSNNGIGPINDKIYDKGLNKCYEVFYFETYNLEYYKKGKYYEMYGILRYPKDGINPSNELFGIQHLSPINNHRACYHAHIIGNVYQFESDEMEFIDSLVTSDSLSFKDILHISYPDGSNHCIYSGMYYAKHIGLVRFKKSSDQSIWELIRYKINQ